MTIAEYNQCVDDHADGVYRFVLKNIRDEEHARDIVQESFIRMWERAETISAEKSRSYLFTTAYHTMIDTIRREKKHTDFDDVNEQEYATDNHFSFSDLKEVLNEAVEKLPDIQRSALLLRDYEGYCYKEIGEITGLNESQVKVYIYPARVFIKKYIGSLDTVI